MHDMFLQIVIVTTTFISLTLESVGRMRQNGRYLSRKDDGHAESSPPCLTQPPGLSSPLRVKSSTKSVDDEDPCVNHTLRITKINYNADSFHRRIQSPPSEIHYLSK